MLNPSPGLSPTDSSSPAEVRPSSRTEGVRSSRPRGHRGAWPESNRIQPESGAIQVQTGLGVWIRSCVSAESMKGTKDPDLK